MCIYELFKNDIEEYEEYEDIDWTFDSNIFSDSDISEMPELEDVEIYETNNIGDIDQYIMHTTFTDGRFT